MDFDSKLPKLQHRNISAERWERAREEADVREILQHLTNNVISGSAISCPFGHGRGSMDSRPSFYIYPQTNSCYCFGCPPNDNFFDPIKLVSKYLEISPSKALLWIEKTLQLPAMTDVMVDDDDEDEKEGERTFLVSFEDLREPFVNHCHKHMLKEPNVDNARYYLQTYWRATRDDNPLPLASVLGADAMKRILHNRK